jgi:hypothetical protein
MPVAGDTRSPWPESVLTIPESMLTLVRSRQSFGVNMVELNGIEPSTS